MLKFATGVAVTFLISGCASSLTTFDENKEPSKGVPIGAPKLVRIVTKTNFKLIKGADPEKYGKYCIAEVDTSFRFLPLGKVHYIGFEPALFGDGEFKLELNDSGNLKHVSLNSDASAGVDPVKGLLGTVLPFIKAPVPAMAVLAAPAAAPAVAARLTDDGQSGDVIPTIPTADYKKLFCQKTGTTEMME